MSASRAQIRRSIARDVRLKAAVDAHVPTLRASGGIAFAAEAGRWNLLFPRGTWHGANLAPVGGSIDLDSGILDEMVANWAAAGKPRLPVRVTHRHLDDDVPAKDRPSLEKAVGWLTDLRVTAQGLEALTEWTPTGKASVEGGEFAFWSPEWQPRHRDRRSGETKGWWLSGTALTNDPFFNEMPPVAASVASTETTDTHTKEQHMTKEQLEALRASLGLAADATVEQILKASSTLVSERDTLKAEAAKLKASTPDAAIITAAVAPIKEQVATLTAELAKRDAALLERDVNDAVVKAKRGDGKMGRTITEPLVARALKIAQGEGLKAAVDFLESLPATVPTAALGVDTKAEGALSASAAQAKLDALAGELRAKGVKDATAQAIAQLPTEALIAQGLATNNRAS